MPELRIEGSLHQKNLIDMIALREAGAETIDQYLAFGTQSFKELLANYNGYLTSGLIYPNKEKVCMFETEEDMARFILERM